MSSRTEEKTKLPANSGSFVLCPPTHIYKSYNINDDKTNNMSYTNVNLNDENVVTHNDSTKVSDISVQNSKNDCKKMFSSMRNKNKRIGCNKKIIAYWSFLIENINDFSLNNQNDAIISNNIDDNGKKSAKQK